MPSDQSQLWAFAQRSRGEAKAHGVTDLEVLGNKADFPTFLAWIDPPGQQSHTAMLTRALDARTPLGLRFARWLVDRSQLTPRDPTLLHA